MLVVFIMGGFSSTRRCVVFPPIRTVFRTLCVKTKGCSVICVRFHPAPCCTRARRFCSKSSFVNRFSPSKEANHSPRKSCLRSPGASRCQTFTRPTAALLQAEPNLNIETETRQIVDYAEIFLKITKCHHHFRISVIFPTCFGCFSPAPDKKYIELQTFSQAMSLQCSRCQGNRLATATCSLRDRDSQK